VVATIITIGEVGELATTKTRLSKIAIEVGSEGMDSINEVALCIIRGNSSRSNSSNLSAMNSSSQCIHRVSAITGLS
jgi:hypothetical protein